VEAKLGADKSIKPHQLFSIPTTKSEMIYAPPSTPTSADLMRPPSQPLDMSSLMEAFELDRCDSDCSFTSTCDASGLGWLPQPEKFPTRDRSVKAKTSRRMDQQSLFDVIRASRRETGKMICQEESANWSHASA
jgi:hypothetical protein